MGTTNSPLVFVSKIRKVATEMEKVPRAGANAAALLIKESVLAEVGAIAPNFTLSGLRGTSKKVGVRYVDGVNVAGHATVLLFATGPLHLLERDTKAHDIYPRNGSVTVLGQTGTLDSRRRGKRGGKRALAGKSFGPFAHARSPGTKGQHPFEHGVDRARPLTARAMKVGVRTALARSVGVI